MNEITIAEWVAALRSGEYKQALYAYKQTKSNTFCALGVQLDLLVKKSPDCLEWRKDWLYKDGQKIEVGQELKLINMPRYLSTAEISLMNDREVPFDKIADRIEAADRS